MINTKGPPLILRFPISFRTGNIKTSVLFEGYLVSNQHETMPLREVERNDSIALKRCQGVLR